MVCELMLLHGIQNQKIFQHQPSNGGLSSLSSNAYGADEGFIALVDTIPTEDFLKIWV